MATYTIVITRKTGANAPHEQNPWAAAAFKVFRQDGDADPKKSAPSSPTSPSPISTPSLTS